MTLIIGWLAVDERSPCSAYIASDSRFSWGKNGAYDFGRKVFAFKSSPDIIGYCGDVLFPLVTLTQLVDICDANLLFENEMSSDQRSKIIFEQIKTQFTCYPYKQSYIINSPISIFHISRDINNSFYAYEFLWTQDDEWEYKKLKMKNSNSNIIFCEGSGKVEYMETYYSKYLNGNNEGTSRNLFQCFCDTLFNCSDYACGGSPQLVGLYRGKKFNGMNFGIIKDKRRYYLGSPIENLNDYNFVRWYNKNFEICNANTMQLEKGAMRQPNPNLMNSATP